MAVGVRDQLPVALGVGVCVGESVPVPVPVSVALEVMDWLRVEEAEAVAVGQAQGVQVLGEAAAWVRLVAAVIQPVPVDPPLERNARDGDVRVRRDARAGVRRPVPGVARGDSSRMMVPLGTFRVEHGVPPGKSNGELFPIAAQSK